MTKKRYIVRLHKLIRQEFDIKARQKGYLTPTFISLIIEDMCKDIYVPDYELHPDSEIFQLKRGRKDKGQVKQTADKQMSIYLSDFAYNKVGEIVTKLQEDVNKSITATFVIRDLLFHWSEDNNMIHNPDFATKENS